MKIQKFKNLSTGKKLLAGLFAFALVLGITSIVMIQINNSRNSASNSATSPSTSASEPAQTWGNDSICGYKPDEKTALNSIPNDWEMKYMYTSYYPTSSTAGPCKGDAETGVWGYAPTVEGAVIASFFIRSGYILGQPYLDKVKEHSIWGEKNKNRATIPSDMRIIPLGFKILDFSENEIKTRITYLAKSMGNSQMIADTIILNWKNGDWKVKLRGDLKAIYLDQQYIDDVKIIQNNES
ncbi:MAG: hypothetical protein LBT99_03275 [Bifidobacteriaceae bacterium]|jgi:hypothetical protein|nr:hypothetical protein [Bifidobacteriaceae bacterium]